MNNCDSVVDYETFDGRRTDEGSNRPEIFEQHKPKLMDRRKFDFVQKYLEDTLETRSATTEASDSALGTQAAASELGTEEISGKYKSLERYATYSHIYQQSPLFVGSVRKITEG